MIYLPFIREAQYVNPIDAYAIFSDNPWSIFLDSAKVSDEIGRYSYIASDPFLKIISKARSLYVNDELINISIDPFLILKTYLAKYSLQVVPDLPPFQGGLAGYLGYDLCHHLEKLPTISIDDMKFPDMLMGFYDVVIAYDHLLKKCWIISTGFPEKENERQMKRALSRSDAIAKKLMAIKKNILPTTKSYCFDHDIKSNFTKSDYIKAIERAKNYILNGDVFEVNLSQRFSVTLAENFSRFELYQKVRAINNAAFSAYLNFGDVVIASTSPERFLKLRNALVETRPIKGTRPRGATEAEDLHYARELMASEKDVAENVMIVDLLRNDLSKVCCPNTVLVPKLCGLESYETVHHLVSVVIGILAPSYDAIDLIKAAFPGGSITGAPKIRSMEIIDEIEPTRRGPYCGAIGYIGFNGEMDTSIVIRTFTIKNNTVAFQAGGAIVADSDPESEYNETLIKAQALRMALTGEGKN